MAELIEALRGMGFLSGVSDSLGTAGLMFGAAAVVLGFALTYEGLATYFERKIAGDAQARIGPNRVGPIGLLQWIADGLKLVLKEDLIPLKADRPLFRMAPYLIFAGSFLPFVVVPWLAAFSVADINIGVLYVFAITSLVVPGILMAGWGSNNKWSLLGGMRAAAQMVSFEVPVVLSIIPAVLVASSLSLQDIVGAQSGGIGLFGWFLFHNPFTLLAFFVFFTASLAECNRTPFDIPEAESELVAGYYTEYTGIRFAMFFMAEYGDMFIGATLAAVCFLGGWNVPVVGALSMPGALEGLLQFGALLSKVSFLIFVMMWVRWTYPRLRVDQLTTLSWKFLTPIAFFNLLGTAVWLILFDGKGIPRLIGDLFGA